MFTFLIMGFIMFTKKHYEAIAGILAENLQTEYYGYTGYASGLADSLCNEFADYFGQDNPLFDKDRFLKVCGVK